MLHKADTSHLFSGRLFYSKKERTKEKVKNREKYVSYLSYQSIHQSIFINIQDIPQEDIMTPFSRYEQETIISFNAGEQTATVYTRDKAVMRKLDGLVKTFPAVYKLTGQTEHDKTYSICPNRTSVTVSRGILARSRENRQGNRW